jgi:hypothetical protein
MGQYWIPVNLTKKQFIDPHKLGSGLKLWEQLANEGVGRALVILLAAMPEQRGGGDLEPDPVIGSWAGSRIAIVGDYAEDSDLRRQKGDPLASKIYFLCVSAGEETPDDCAGLDAFTDVTDAVCKVIEKELGGKFTGSGWRKFTREA